HATVAANKTGSNLRIASLHTIGRTLSRKVSRSRYRNATSRSFEEVASSLSFRLAPVLERDPTLGLQSSPTFRGRTGAHQRLRFGLCSEPSDATGKVDAFYYRSRTRTLRNRSRP